MGQYGSSECVQPPLIAVIEVPNAIMRTACPPCSRRKTRARPRSPTPSCWMARRSSKGEAPYVKVGAATAAGVRRAASSRQGFAVLCKGVRCVVGGAAPRLKQQSANSTVQPKPRFAISLIVQKTSFRSVTHANVSLATSSRSRSISLHLSISLSPLGAARA